MLAESIHADHFSIGSLIREKHIHDERVHQGELLPDNVVNPVVQEEVSAVNPSTAIIIDGFPRRLTQKQWLDQLLMKEGRTDVHVLHLDVSDEEIDRRLASRGREDDTPQAIALRKRIFAQEVAPVIASYEEDGVLHTITGEGEREEIQTNIADELGL